ncbi:MAG TPA: hypothetical protein VGL72_20050 [Bryobacteraceae bacterium]
MADAGINKPYDRILKAFVDEAPALFLRLLGIVPPGATIDLKPLRPETAPTVVMPDYVAMLQIDHDTPFIFHVEFFVAYSHDIPATMARYGVSLAAQYQIRVESVLVLLRPRRSPAHHPAPGSFQRQEDEVQPSLPDHPLVES